MKCPTCKYQLVHHCKCTKCGTAYAFLKEAMNCCNSDSKIALWCEKCFEYKDMKHKGITMEKKSGRKIQIQCNNSDKEWSKKYVELNYVNKAFDIVENQRITDNNDYISIPIEDWENFRNKIKTKNQGEIIQDYGKEIIIDLHECNPKTFTRQSIRNYFKEVTALVDMERCKLCWWDDLYTPQKEKETEPHLVGTSAVQFIKTSNITIHTLDMLKKTYINLFSCKDFDENIVIAFSKKWFQGKVVNKKVVRRI